MTITLEDIQRRVGVDPDGKLGPDTLAAIAKALNITTAPGRRAMPPHSDAPKPVRANPPKQARRPALAVR